MKPKLEFSTLGTKTVSPLMATSKPESKKKIRGHFNGISVMKETVLFGVSLSSRD